MYVSFFRSAQLPATIEPGKALQSFISQHQALQDIICHDLVSVAGKLYSRGIISHTTHSYATNPKVYTPEDRTTELLKAVESQIRVRPSIFKEFIFILESEPYTSSLADELIQSYSEFVIFLCLFSMMMV